METYSQPVANQPRAGTSMHSFRTDDELWEAAKVRAEAEGKTMSALLVELLTEYAEAVRDDE